jgi:type VI secretion system ImpB/VipA family protein
LELNFGFMAGDATERKIAAAAPFRLAVLGDFSGGANKGRLETGDDLARRKPMRVDVDNLDKTIERLGITLSLPLTGEGAVEFAVAGIDDFHPDQIYEKVDLFSGLADLRQRLGGKAGPAAATQLSAWRTETVSKTAVAPPRARGSAVPKSGKLSDFAALIGQPSAPPSHVEVAIEDLIKSIVQPYIVNVGNPQPSAFQKSVNTALAATLRKILHHPDFQILESLWRSVDMLTRRIETSIQVQIILYDVSAEEFAADLASTDTLEDSGLYRLLVEQPETDAGQGPISVIVGAYVFDQTPPQAELLGRMAKLAARANAPFIASITPEFLETAPEDVHPLIREAWDGLAALGASAYLGLVTPRFLLRQPYGDRTDPIDSVNFEEFTRQTGLKGMLWGNPAFIAGMLLAQAYSKLGPKMDLNTILGVGDMPYYVYEDVDGEQTALPCTERLITERIATRVKAERFMPLLSIKGRPEIRLGGFTALSGTALRGRWLPPGAVPAKKPEPEVAKPSPKPVTTVKPTAPVPGGAPLAAKPEATAKSESSGDAELDKLLASLDDTPQEAPAAAAAAAPAEGAAAEDDMAGVDPELAALLKGL